MSNQRQKMYKNPGQKKVENQKNLCQKIYKNSHQNYLKFPTKNF